MKKIKWLLILACCTAAAVGCTRSKKKQSPVEAQFQAVDQKLDQWGDEWGWGHNHPEAEGESSEAGVPAEADPVSQRACTETDLQESAKIMASLSGQLPIVESSLDVATEVPEQRQVYLSQALTAIGQFVEACQSFTKSVNIKDCQMADVKSELTALETSCAESAKRKDKLASLAQHVL